MDNVVKLTLDNMKAIFPHATNGHLELLTNEIAKAHLCDEVVYVHHTENWYQMVMVAKNLEKLEQIQELLHNPEYWARLNNKIGQLS